VNTDYPSDLVARTNIHAYPQAAGCPTLQTDFRSALINLAIENAEITIPAGKGNGCTLAGFTFDYSALPPDVKQVANTKINSDGSVVITNINYAENQQVIITPGSAGVPNGIVLTNYQGADRRLYYL
jgi:hypothetical protein